MGPRAVLDLVRLPNAAMAAAAVAASAVVAGAGRPDLVHVALAAASAAAIAGAGNSLNDAGDADVDRQAHPERPIPRGDATPRQARILAYGGFGAGILLGAAVGRPTAAVAGSAVVLLMAYERGLKGRGLAGNATVSLLVGALFLYGGVAVGRLGAPAATLALLAALSTMGREVLKDAEDRDADEGRATLARTGGPRAAAWVGAACLLAAVALSPLPVLVEPPLGRAYAPVVALADLGFVAAAFQGFGSPGRAQRTAKASMGVALLGFLVGRAPGVAP
jgi:geranylgeranylglycerol-phosphate geranylgeranyltransferase